MYEIGIRAQFEAAHRLVGNFGPATRFHGHTYTIEVLLRGEQLQADGTLHDIAQLQNAVGALTATLHYRDLGEVPGLSGINTTAENLAHYCWEQLAYDLRGRGLASLCVRIWENPQAYAARDEAL